MSYTVARFGWIRDIPDHRDHLYAAPVKALTALPANVDLSAQCPAVYDQGELGSCTANAIAAALEFDRLKQKIEDFIPSRLFIYYNERVIEHSVHSDSGAQIRDGIKSVSSKGDCPETEWPYDITKFAQKPPQTCYKDAKRYHAVQYQHVVQDLTQMKGCLASGYPFVFGFTVYQGFMGDTVKRTGHATMPRAGETVVGGHAVLAVGYDDAQNWFVVRNSWGTAWGMKGYFTLPYAYLQNANLASDFWTIRLVT